MQPLSQELMNKQQSNLGDADINTGNPNDFRSPIFDYLCLNLPPKSHALKFVGFKSARFLVPSNFIKKNCKFLIIDTFEPE
jgi:hypothetical protein